MADGHAYFLNFHFEGLMPSSKLAHGTTVLILEKCLHTLSQGILEGVFVSQLFILPGQYSWASQTLLASVSGSSSASEEGTASQEGEGLETASHCTSGSLSSVFLTLPWQPHGFILFLAIDLHHACCWEWHLPLV